MSPHHTQKEPYSQDESRVFPIYKHAGETLAVLVERFRKEQALGENVPITYAGRLDPMADGLVLLLTGEACKDKDSYLGLDKTYTFEVLFGVSTDTFDMLGLITDTKDAKPTEAEIQEAINVVSQRTSFSYPPFSSKPVGGIPLFEHAKAGTLPDVMPSIKGEIKSLILKEYKVVTFGEAVNKSLEIVRKVEGDFRQKEIVEGWQNFLKDMENEKCVLVTLETSVSSGVYVRSIAVSIGESLGVPSLAYSITRTKVGEYSI